VSVTSARDVGRTATIRSARARTGMVTGARAGLTAGARTGLVARGNPRRTGLADREDTGPGTRWTGLAEWEDTGPGPRLPGLAEGVRDCPTVVGSNGDTHEGGGNALEADAPSVFTQNGCLVFARDRDC
jgi:hypothetical protein